MTYTTPMFAPKWPLTLTLIIHHPFRLTHTNELQRVQHCIIHGYVPLPVMTTIIIPPITTIIRVMVVTVKIIITSPTIVVVAVVVVMMQKPMRRVVVVVVRRPCCCHKAKVINHAVILSSSLVLHHIIIFSHPFYPLTLPSPLHIHSKVPKTRKTNMTITTMQTTTE